MSIFGDLERYAADLYPYRWPITVVLLAGVVAVVAVGLRQRWPAALWRHRLATLAIAVPLLAATLPVGWYSLSPLWQRKHLEEASPLNAQARPRDTVVSSTGTSASTASKETPAVAASATSAPAGTAVAPFDVRTTHLGMFVGADDFHFGRGRARLIETAPGAYTLRLEEFSVRNGPDLYVYLTPSADGDSIDGAINLGELKATDGSFNYEIPPGTDVSGFRNAVVWCRQFAVLFAAAPLDPA